MRTLLAAAAVAAAAAAAPSTINSGQPWFDTDGKRIYAGGGGFMYESGLYYWIGEGEKVYRDVSEGFGLYSSPDLLSWTNHGYAFMNTSIIAPPQSEPYRMERPKIFRCPGTGKHMLWFHCDSIGFGLQSVGVASADSVTGPYTMSAPCFHPDGLASYDMGVYQDGTGTYLVRSVENQYAGISAMNGDCTNVTGIISSGPKIEGQAIMNFNGSYFLWGSHLTGWAPNPAVFSVGGSALKGSQWTQLGNPSNDPTTFNSQSTFILPYTHADGHVTYIYMGDRWNANGPGGLQNMSYVWLPLTPPSSAGGDWSMPWRDAWNPANF